MTHPAAIAALGYTPIPTMPQNPRARAPEWYEGCGVDVAGGKQPDGRYLLALDLDSHEGQDADATLAYLRAAMPRIAPRLAIRQSQSGNGYHIPILLGFDPDIPSGARLYRTDTRQHVGEVISARITLSGTWVQGGIDTLPVLLFSEWQMLRGVLTTGGQTAADQGSPRQARMAEGVQLIQGWESVAGWREQLDALCAKDQILANYRAKLRTHANRSDTFGGFVQSLMLRAGWSAGRGVADRCCVIAAMAIGTGAGGKEQEKDYDIVKDTATLIARILHGDSYGPIPEDGQQPKRWTIPGWATRQLPTPPAPTVAEPRPRGRPAGDQRKRLIKLLRLIERTTPDDFGRRILSLDTMAAELKVAPRTAQTYLEKLRAGDEPHIKTGQIGGNGVLYILLLKSMFGGADKSPKGARFGDADQNTVQAVPVLEKADCSDQCIEEHQKASAPPPAQPGCGVFGVPLPASTPPTLRVALAEVFDAAGPGAKVTRKRAVQYLAANYPDLRYQPHTLDRVLHAERKVRAWQKEVARIAQKDDRQLEAARKYAEKRIVAGFALAPHADRAEGLADGALEARQKQNQRARRQLPYWQAYHVEVLRLQDARRAVALAALPEQTRLALDVHEACVMLDDAARLAPLVNTREGHAVKVAPVENLTKPNNSADIAPALPPRNPFAQRQSLIGRLRSGKAVAA